ncbi:MAG: oligoribonuclease [Myxococcales bacterium]|nr:oligoribonuclease [Myxococcales bacterium]MCB9628232.1 oligoribonuclease [Sandaracinaceae bacterium]
MAETEQQDQDPRAARIVWADLEMTGLVPERERIIEIAMIITDGELNVIAEGPNLVVHQPDELLAAMDEWNTKHHGQSGLTERVRESTVTEADAEAQVLAFLEQHCAPRTVPLAGNSIHQDRRFLALYMPLVDAFLHYRMIDVSTLKELTQRWYPEAYSKRPAKRGNHRAIDDILESIEELRYYRSAVFR